MCVDNRPAEDGDVFAMLRPWTGDGLLVANGKRWERNRRLLDTAFHNDILRSYVGVFNKTADIFLVGQALRQQVKLKVTLFTEKLLEAFLYVRLYGNTC